MPYALPSWAPGWKIAENVECNLLFKSFTGCWRTDYDILEKIYNNYNDNPIYLRSGRIWHKVNF